MRSYMTPAPARTTSFWFPKTSHAKPARGPKLFVSLFQMLLSRTWNEPVDTVAKNGLSIGKKGLVDAVWIGVTGTPK